MSLTDTTIRTAKASDKTQKLFGGGGLYLEIAPSGGKWWRLKYRFDGKEKRISFGVYPNLSRSVTRCGSMAGKPLHQRSLTDAKPIVSQGATEKQNEGAITAPSRTA